MNNRDAYQFADQHARRNADGSVVEEDLVDLVESVLDFDARQAKRGLAQRIVAARKRPGATAPEGAVVFPGMELYAYEPHRLLADDTGNVIENQHARMRFKAAEAKRAQEDAKRATDRAAREQNEAGHFAVWAADELAKGRPVAEVTWDTCVRETGLWKDAEPEAPDEADGGEAS